MARQRPSALLIDLDGVLRHWDPQVHAEIEERYGLSPGTVLAAAMRWPLLQPAVSGQISHADWLTGVAHALTEAAGGADRARAAVDEWAAYRGEVDAEVLAFVQAVRANGIRVGLATNATDALDADLATLDLVDEVDVVVNSSVLGVHKPAKDYFQQACLAGGVPPRGVLFVDGDDGAVRGAGVAGLSAYRGRGPRDLPYLRAALAA